MDRPHHRAQRALARRRPAADDRMDRRRHRPLLIALGITFRISVVTRVPRAGGWMRC